MLRLRRALLASAAMGSGQTYAQKVLALNPIAYWPVADVAGATSVVEYINAWHATPANLTLGQTGIGDGRTSGLFDGASSTLDLYTAGLNAAFGKSEGSAQVWYRVTDAGVWTNGASGRLLTLTQDTNNRIYIAKSATNNLIECYYYANGVAKGINIATSSTEWLNIMITWSLSNDRFRVYLNSSQVGADATGLGTWAAGNLLVAETLVGARALTGANWLSGYIAHVAIWDREL